MGAPLLPWSLGGRKLLQGSCVRRPSLCCSHVAKPCWGKETAAWGGHCSPFPLQLHETRGPHPHLITCRAGCSPQHLQAMDLGARWAELQPWPLLPFGNDHGQGLSPGSSSSILLGWAAGARTHSPQRLGHLRAELGELPRRRPLGAQLGREAGARETPPGHCGHRGHRAQTLTESLLHLHRAPSCAALQARGTAGALPQGLLVPGWWHSCHKSLPPANKIPKSS